MAALYTVPMPPEPTTTPMPWANALVPRRSRRVAAWLAMGLGIVLLAAWAVPPMLDWGRFRTQIAAIAAARLGRPVSIGGEITLRLLPQAVLTANDVTLGQSGGDGVFVQVGALRLQIGTLPLLIGDLRLHELVLSAPVLRLPLILPAGSRPSRPLVPHPFAARIEHGTLRLGQTEIAGITASIHGGPALASIQGSLSASGAPVAAFGAEGFATIGGRVWRFTGALGAPDADGVSAVDLAMHGQGVAADTGGAIQATLADGVLQGRLHASGGDLSLLMTASPLDWKAEAPFVASVDRVEAAAISLSLGGAPADGALSLSLDRPARIEGRLHAATLNLDGWAALLGRQVEWPSGPGLLPRLHIALSADGARLLGGILHDVRATLVADGRGLGFDEAAAVLPGGALLSAAHARFGLSAAHARFGGPGQAGTSALAGDAALDAPDLRPVLAWLQPVSPTLITALPDQVLRSAHLSAHMALSRNGLSWTGLSGQVDGAALTGAVCVRLGAIPHLDATLAMPALAADNWFSAGRFAGGLQDAGSHLAAADADLQVSAARVTLRGFTLENARLDAHAGPTGLQLHELTARLGGADLSLSGALGADGRLVGGRASVNTGDLAKLAALLPARWQSAAPGLWRGQGKIVLAAEGPPDALALQLRADAGDMVMEAEALRDTLAGTGTATVTLRHPGAPRLVVALGLAGAESAAAAWLDTGSLTLRTHLSARPGHLSVQDFDLDAAALRMGGHLEADWSGNAPLLTGMIAAEQLALPDSLPHTDLAIPPRWTARLHLSAREVSLGLRPEAANFSLDLESAGPGVLANGVEADIAGGHLSGQVAADLSTRTLAARGTLSGAHFDENLAAGPSLTVLPGPADADFDLLSRFDLASLSGTAELRLGGMHVTGFDVAALGRAALLHGRAGRLAQHKAMSQGETSGLSGTVQASITPEAILLGPATLTSPAGSVRVSGRVDRAKAGVTWTVRRK